MDYTFSPLKNIDNVSLTVKIKLGKIKLLCGDIERIPVQDAAYDLVFNEGVIEHWLDVKDRACIIREMLRVVRQGGYVVITVPNGGHRFHERWERSGYPGYLKAPPMTLYDFKKLKLEMEKAGLKDVKVEGIQPFSSFNQWPNYSWLKYPIAILNRLPLPKSLRCKWGIHLVGIGRR